MAVDSTLISGAYDANNPQELQTVKGISKITKAIVDPVKNYMNAKIAEHTIRNLSLIHI